MPRTKQTARKSTVGTQRRATRAEKLELSHPQNKLTRFQTKLLETDPFPLMKLPLELREMVYLHAMMPASSSPADPRIKAQHHVTASKCPLLVCLNQLPASLVILRVNWKTHREAIEVFRKKFIFCLDPLDCRQLKRIPHHVHYQGIRKIAVACVAGYHLGGSQERDWLQRKNDDRMRYWARNLTGLREVGKYVRS